MDSIFYLLVKSNVRKENTECRKLVGIKVDCKLKFKNYLDVIKTASNKVNALSRVTSFMSLAKKRKLMNFL